MMNRIQCELCGSIDVIKTGDNLFQCQHCGCKYTLEQAKSLIGTAVEVVKGNLELERRLKNADTKLGFGEYQKAYEEYMSLCEDYPFEHIVHMKALSCRRQALLSGYEVLNAAVLQGMYVIYKKATATAHDPQAQENIQREYYRFFEDFTKAVAENKGCRLDYIDIFHFAYDCFQKNNALPVLLTETVLWTTVAEIIAAGLKAKKISLFSSCERLIYSVNKTYETIEIIAKMHPSLKAALEIGYRKASQYNDESIRVGYFADLRFCHFDWIKAGVPALNQLYVHVDFVATDVVFASYWEWFGVLKNFIYRDHFDVTEEFQTFLREKNDKNFALETWNNKKWNCPFCDSKKVSISIFGRKCQSCGRSFPRV